jgi:hypothetical protein
MVKYRFNEHWRARDQAYKELPDALLKNFLAVLTVLSEQLCPRRKGPGRPPKIGPKEAGFLAAVKEYHHQMPYRELAASRYVEWLGIAGVHYTAIQKAIDRLPRRLFDEAIRTLAEMVSSREIEAVADATCFRRSEIRD